MGLLSWLFRRSRRRRDATASEPPKAPVIILDGPDSLEVVGESFHQDVLRRAVGPNDGYVRIPVVAILAAEFNNKYDSNAIAVWVAKAQVGHLSREDAATFRAPLLRLEQQVGGPVGLPGVIVGGGEGRPSYGVFLNYDAAAFGVRPLRFARKRSENLPVGEHIRTGLSRAIVSDPEDESFDLGWRMQLPSDRNHAIDFLRQGLTNERGPISRHFMYSQLEEYLYIGREESASALGAYDAVCEAHQAEMPTIRAALIASLGGVPLIEMYRQASIRHQKAHAWGEALRWAELGIQAYGADALRPDFVDELQHRIAMCREKLETNVSRPRPMAETHHKSANTEVLVCTSCGRSFQHAVSRGRKPLRCPDCREPGMRNAAPRAQEVQPLDSLRELKPDNES